MRSTLVLGDNDCVSTPNPAARMPMTGAVDLAALAAAREAQAKAEARIAAGVTAPASVSILDVSEADFQAEVLDRSFQVPVVIDMWAQWCEPCKALTPLLEALTVEYAGKFVLAKIDVDANPRIQQAFQVQSIPAVIAVIKGSPMPLFQGAIPEPQIREILEELLRVAAANGVSGTVGEQSGDIVAEEPASDPLFDTAYDAIELGDWDGAEAAYQTILLASPKDEDARLGLGQVQLMRRADGVDLEQALLAADNDPDSVAAQTLAADIDLLGGHVVEAFDRLIDLVRRTTGDERAAARTHLVALFALVSDDDPRVARARTALANALF